MMNMKKHNHDTVTDNAQSDTEPGTNLTELENESHAYKMKLRSHGKQVLSLTCTVENLSETEFYENVDQILNELNIDCYSFYR